MNSTDDPQTATKLWLVRDECGDDVIEARDSREAEAKAEAWLADGDWGDGGCEVECYVAELEPVECG